MVLLRERWARLRQCAGKILLCVAVVTASLVALSADVSAAAKNSHHKNGLKTPKILVIGSYLGVKPLAYVKGGKPSGYDPDLVRAFARYLHVKAEIKNLTFSGLIPGVQSGKFDMAATGIFATPARKKVVAFSRFYMPTVVILAVPDKGHHSSKISTYNKPSVTVMAETGSETVTLAKKFFPKAKLSELSLETNILQAVASGRATAAVIDEFIVKTWSKANPGEVTVAPLKKPLTITWGAWAIRKGNKILVREANRFLCHAQKDGLMAKLYEKNFGISSFPKPPGRKC